MAARGSFQKHQKEIARKEKREQKLARRQGRAHGPKPGGGPETEESPAQPEAPAGETETEPAP